MKTIVLAVLPMLIVGGCALTNDHAALEDRTAMRLEAMLATGPGSARAGAVKLPADAGSFKGKVETADASVHRQEVVLSGSVPGQPVNRVEILAARSGLGNGSPGALLKPTDAGIHAEIAKRFPRVAMKVVVEPRHNAYGQFGLAIGAASRRVRCIYAWQYIDDLQVAENGQGPRPLFHTASSLAASVRMSVCRADKTADELAGFVEQLQIDASALQPQAAAAPLSAPEQQEPAAKATSLEASLGPAPETTPVRVRKPKAAARRKLRRTRVAAAKSVALDSNRSEDAVDQAVAADRGVGGRVPKARRTGMIPMPSDPGGVQGGAVPVFATSAPPAKLDASLPSQAYQGPSSAKPARSRAPEDATGTIPGGQQQ